jgi:hypothetical protein
VSDSTTTTERRLGLSLDPGEPDVARPPPEPEEEGRGAV